MVNETQLDGSVVRDGSNAAQVVLGADHPGFRDPAYRARRNALAELALSWKPGSPVPTADYSREENEVWQMISLQLEPLHHRHACRAYLEAKEELRIPTDRIPQLDDVTTLLSRRTGFAYRPIAGLAPLREFYGAFSGSVFLSTQYVRHPSCPLYTPEPDVVHEVLGHAHQLADPEFAAIYRAVGEAVARIETEDALRILSRVFWFSFEFGVVWEDGELRAYGAGILSSCGETSAFREAEIRPIDLPVMGTMQYDITRYQPVLFAANSKGHLVDTLSEFFSTFDDEVSIGLAEEAARRGVPGVH